MSIKAIKSASREEWLKLRMGFVGGSDAAAVVGLNPFQSPYSLWAEKRGISAPFEGNLATEVGSFLEEFVAKKFENETGKKVRRNNRSLVNDKYPWALADIDREIVGENAILEIKTTSELNTKRFKNGEYPPQYYVQVMHYLAVTEAEKGYLAVLIGNRDFRVFEIERDEDEIAALMEAEKEFWGKVKDGVEPEVDGTASTTEALSEVYPKSDEDEIDLVGYDEILQHYFELAAQIKALKELQDEYVNQLKQYMGDAGKAKNDNYSVSWTTSVRRTFDAKAFAADHAGMDLSQWYKETSTRMFRVTERKKEEKE